MISLGCSFMRSGGPSRSWRVGLGWPPGDPITLGDERWQLDKSLVVTGSGWRALSAGVPDRSGGAELERRYR